ncbi:hypothetical protein Xcel_1196 [Xylanimonas cellulosilytica DSM 15894]|uniref:Uncharacterized protein n=1 Tax=Xylanimonas cellulosilytica (strain DSM 15894 / JCM 12276 / CECT 5975 / KCTC 9989 / LMG 20990 / NBRC 107835 / XIL07) TaxID=446471 RepID=D1C038_XYLCX|nr:hypothetical protein [Xylanimonas cellulosilytica]ACZ30227.1 hypothetical protein Xcel_1196 [Xylanimonas cellulosilytica DSM 15894]
MPTPTATKLTPAVATWADRQATPGLGLTEALVDAHQDWSTGPAANHDEHLRRLATISELAEALKAATVHAALEAVEAGLPAKEVAATLGSTAATVTKWVKEARAAA